MFELKMKKKVEQPVVSTEETHFHEHNEGNFNLPLKFDEYKEHERETTEEEEEEEEEEDYGSNITQDEEGEILHVKRFCFVSKEL